MLAPVVNAVARITFEPLLDVCPVLLMKVVTVCAAATWKTSESPYMVWVNVFIPEVPLSRGPWPLPEELGRPSRTRAAPSCRATAPVPSSSQPVQG